MSFDVIVQALIVAGVTALATGFVNGKIMQSHLEDLKQRIERIEKYLNGLLKK
jgi:hypothetical protein